ncbi:MAG: methyltransferase domain-containing protein [Chthoniobacterales bacterium]
MSARQFEAAEPEWMDRPDATPGDLEGALRSLRGLNRYFGSYRLVRHFLRRWIKRGDEMRVLDLATGSGDIPRLIVDHAGTVGAKVKITALDFQPTTVAIAKRWSADCPEIRFQAADALNYECEERFDIVICSLALHHFSLEDAVKLLRKCREMSRRFVLVADLCRGFPCTVGVYLLTALVFNDAMTKNDGRVSAARAFSFDELRDLARRAGWENFGAKKFRFARQAVWLE